MTTENIKEVCQHLNYRDTLTGVVCQDCGEEAMPCDYCGEMVTEENEIFNDHYYYCSHACRQASETSGR